MENKRLSLLTDFYELTMANAYFQDGREKEIAIFDFFFRKIPDNGGYAVFAGLEQVINYIQTLNFTDEELKFLASKKIFSSQFLKYLKTFKFDCDIYSMKEGTPIFPNEPIMIVKGPIIQCQLIETMLLLSVNHQSLIATKATRIVRSALGRNIIEFGARRAHSYDAATLGARAAYIGGVVGTSNTLADYLHQVPALGTMAHSYIQSFDNEYDAFKSYALNYPDSVTLLVDTYDTLKSGVPNTIKVYNEVLKPLGKKVVGIRIDSGDLAYLSIKARQMLDEAGMQDTKISASNSLDEYIIKDLLQNQNAKIDYFGVGERLITARSESVFGGVYKLSALVQNNKIIPKIKISENVSKTTLPGFKQVYRFYDEQNKAIADVITLHDEVIDPTKPYRLFDPIHPWKEKIVTNYKIEKLLQPIYIKGQLVYKLPQLKTIKQYAQKQLTTLWEEVLRLEYPHQYYVDLSQDLWDLSNQMIQASRQNEKG